MAKLRSKIVFRVGTDDPPGAVGSDTFETVGNITTFNGLDISKAEIDVSDQDSVLREFFGDLADPGSFTIAGNRNFGNTGQETLRGDMATPGRQRNFQVEFQDSGGTPVETIDVVGEVFEFTTDASFGSQVTWSARVRASGAPTYS